MELSMTTPALIFPALSLVMLAYTHRYTAMASVIRALHDRYKNGQQDASLAGQITNLRFRLVLIRQMQSLGVLSILIAIICMLFIYLGYDLLAHISFGISLLLFAASLILSLVEIQKSTRSLELELSDMEVFEKKGVWTYMRKVIGRE